MTSDGSDRLDEAYRDGGRLRARIAFHERFGVHALAAEMGAAWPDARVAVPDALSFTAENGEACLGSAFDHVERVVFDDALLVDEAPPLAAYLASLVYVDADALERPLRAWLDGFARERLASGPLVVHRVSALFSAR